MYSGRETISGPALNGISVRIVYLYHKERVLKFIGACGVIHSNAKREIFIEYSFKEF